MPSDLNTNIYGVTEEENNAGGRSVGSPVMTIMHQHSRSNYCTR